MSGKLYQENAGTKTKEGKRKLADRIKELCDEQGVEQDSNISEADVRAFLTLTHAEKNILNLIARGYPVRNANAVIRVLEMKMDRSSPRPQAAQGESAAITVTVNTISEPTTITTTRDTIPAVKN